MKSVAPYRIVAYLVAVVCAIAIPLTIIFVLHPDKNSEKKLVSGIPPEVLGEQVLVPHEQPADTAWAGKYFWLRSGELGVVWQPLNTTRYRTIETTIPFPNSMVTIEKTNQQFPTIVFQTAPPEVWQSLACLTHNYENDMHLSPSCILQVNIKIPLVWGDDWAKK